MPDFMRTSSPAAIAATLLLASLAGSASAQDALGDGRALDASPGQYGSGNYQRPSLADELRFRNSIATGNAPGGLSFRGDLGYRAAGEFTGDLGSDSLFAFRRDSLYSGLAGMGIRGTDAIQYQFALTTGSAPPQNLMGNLSFTRDDLYSSSASASYRQGATSQTRPSTVIGIDQDAAAQDLRGQQLSVPATDFGVADAGSMLGTLRSSSTYTTTSGLQPSLLSVFEEGIDRKPVGLIASPLLGISATPMAEEEKPANPLVGRPINADVDPATPGNLGTTKMTTSYDQLVQQMRDHVQGLREGTKGDRSTTINPSETNDAWLVRQMEDLRAKLYGTKPANDGPTDGANAPTDPMNPQPAQDAKDGADANAQGGEGDPGSKTGLSPVVSIPADPESPLSKVLSDARERNNVQPGGAREFELYDPTEIAIDPETLEVLRGTAANEVERLLDPGAANRNIYAEHMTMGEKLIRDGRYFDAEERFTHALSLKPHDIPAQLGRLHAQIGAGMVLSASVNLQSLFSTNPELIASRYSGELLPSGERMGHLVTRLGERAGIIEPEIRTRQLEGDRVRVSAAMLYAYLGYQQGDQQIVGQGLGVVRELGAESDRRFASLLAQVWADTPSSRPSVDPGK